MQPGATDPRPPHESLDSGTLVEADSRGFRARQRPNDTLLQPMFGEWLSLVEHLVRDQGVGGSNPLSPTIQNKEDSEASSPKYFFAAASSEGVAKFASSEPTQWSAFLCPKPRRQRLRRAVRRAAPVGCRNLPSGHRMTAMDNTLCAPFGRHWLHPRGRDTVCSGSGRPGQPRLPCCRSVPQSRTGLPSPWSHTKSLFRP